MAFLQLPSKPTTVSWEGFYVFILMHEKRGTMFKYTFAADSLPVEGLIIQPLQPARPRPRRTYVKELG